MAAPRSPHNGPYNGYEDDLMFTADTANFIQDISDKMRVPKRITATGEYSDEDHLISNQNGIMNSWNYSDNKIDMNVPDRIVVIGQDQILGTRSAPREIILEDSILPRDSGFIRVATPPRVITLSEHHFPSASDEPQQGSSIDDDDNYGRIRGNGGGSPTILHANVQPTTVGFNTSGGNFSGGGDATIEQHESERRLITPGSIRKNLNYGGDNSVASLREGTPPLSELTAPHDEIYNLRRQLAKVNRRVLSIEIENVQRQQREKIIYCLGLAYFFLKAIFWLNRN